MQMDAKEIGISYKTAKNKSKQIGILAELNTCSRKDIIRILQEQGLTKTISTKDKRTEAGEGGGEHDAAEGSAEKRIDKDAAVHVHNITGGGAFSAPPEAVLRLVTERLGYLEAEAVEMNRKFVENCVERETLQDWIRQWEEEKREGKQ